MSKVDNPNILEITDLQVRARIIAGTARLLDIPSLCVRKGETLGVVGESGSGKSVLAQTIMRLLPSNVYVPKGSIKYKGEDLLRKPLSEMSSKIRGKEITMIFQDPMASLNPVFTVGQLIQGVVKQHDPHIKDAEARKQAVKMLDLVKLSDPEMTLEKYPHELSGGMRQRVLIAMALSVGAKMLISDEATRSLDVTIQAGVLRVLAELRTGLSLSGLFISNNIALAAAISQRIGILYCGSVVEVGSVADVIKDPRHFYTVSFLASLPNPNKKGKPLPISLGRNPDIVHKPAGCVFWPRCQAASEECHKDAPLLQEITPGHFVACMKGGVKHQ